MEENESETKNRKRCDKKTFMVCSATQSSRFCGIKLSLYAGMVHGFCRPASSPLKVGTAVSNLGRDDKRNQSSFRNCFHDGEVIV